MTDERPAGAPPIDPEQLDALRELASAAKLGAIPVDKQAAAAEAALKALPVLLATLDYYTEASLAAMIDTQAAAVAELDSFARYLAGISVPAGLAAAQTIAVDDALDAEIAQNAATFGVDLNDHDIRVSVLAIARAAVESYRVLDRRFDSITASREHLADGVGLAMLGRAAARRYLTATDPDGRNNPAAET